MAKPTSGVIKDTVVVPTYGRASVDFTADQPGRDAVPLPYPAAHGLRVQGAAALRLRDQPGLTVARKIEEGGKGNWYAREDSNL